MKKNDQAGFSVVQLLLIVVVVGLGIVAFVTLSDDDEPSAVSSVMASDDDEPSAASPSGSNPSPQAEESSAKITHLGIDLDYFDPSTNMAGDVKFVQFDTKAGGLDAIFSEYGRPAPANNGMGAGRLNPQPTFVAPLGTEVHALLDGKVFKVEKLYSGDYSVMVMPKGSNLVFETEHVQDVRVKEGDRVKAGDVVGVVSDYDARNLNGMGLVEIGVLLGEANKPPKHLCTFDYLDESIKDETLEKITALETAWEEFVGDSNVYQQETEPIAGCRTRDAIEDSN